MAYNRRPEYESQARTYGGQQEQSFNRPSVWDHTLSNNPQSGGFPQAPRMGQGRHYDQYHPQDESYGPNQRGWSDQMANSGRHNGWHDSRRPREHGHNGYGQNQRNMQNGQQRPAEYEYSHGDARPRAVPHKQRKPIVDYHRAHQDQYYQQPVSFDAPSGYQQPYDEQQRSRPLHIRDEYDFGSPYNDSPDDWQHHHQQQGYEPTASRNRAEPQYNGNQHHQDSHATNYDNGQPYSDKAPAPQSQNYVRAERSIPQPAAHVQHSVRSPDPERAKRTKQQPKRILDDYRPPDTVAWDTPFPSFPLKNKKSVPDSGTDNGDSEGDARSFHSARQDKCGTSRLQTMDSSHKQVSGSRPQTSSSKDSYGSGQIDDRTVENTIDVQGGHHDYPDGRLPTTLANKGSSSQIPGRPRLNQGHHVPTHLESLDIPIVQGRHSEDNRVLPSAQKNPSLSSGYDRSRTMPASVTDNFSNFDDNKSSTAGPWQEPGAVAGYYGPEDKGYLPNSASSVSLQNPQMPSRAHSDDSKSHQRLPPINNNLQQSHRGAPDIDFNNGNSQTRGMQGYQPYNANGDRPRSASLESDMPNFEDVQTPTSAHARGMTIDQHLQIDRARQPLPPLPLHAEPQHPPTFRAVNTSGRDPLPRSRSQPDFQDRRSPRALNDQGFDFGVPGVEQRRPTTAASQNHDHFARRKLPAAADGNYQEYSQAPFGRAQRPGQGWTPEAPAQASSSSWQSPDPRAQANVPWNDYQQGRKQDRFPPPSAQDRRYHPDDRIQKFGVHSPSRGLTPQGPSPQRGNGPTTAPNRPPGNPDALPHHPAPVRPGLMDGSLVNPRNKPPPVRNYEDSRSPPISANPNGMPKGGSSDRAQGGSGPVTYEELDRLRQKTNSAPEDQATRLVLAKKLVEASTTLVNERADTKTREKARDDYISQALKMLKKLAGNQYPGAMFYLGDCYSRGALGLTADVKEAFVLYQSAAKANHAQAAYRVAVCCEIGQDEGGGTRKDPIKAMQWYKRAATLGDVPAMYKMGIIQLKGLLGQPRNAKEALIFLERAAEKADRENPHALHELGLLHEKGSDGVPQDEPYSRKLFIQAANLGYKFSQYRLGCAYEYGLIGCAVDPRQSIAWYSKAAVQEEHQSELALSGWYLTGSEGVLQQSDTEAYLWARKAAQAGLAKAEYAMGYFTEVGIGAPANLEDAKRWYWRAASQNFPKARERLEDLRKGGAAKQKTRVSRSHMKKQSDGECTIM